MCSSPRDLRQFKKEPPTPSDALFLEKTRVEGGASILHTGVTYAMRSASMS